MTVPTGLIKWVVDSRDRTHNAVVLLATLVAGSVLVVGEVCAMLIIVGLSPTVGSAVGLMFAAPAAGIAVKIWRGRRRRSTSLTRSTRT